MLSPDELAVLPERMLAIYRELEASIIRDVIRRIASSGAMTESALHQMRTLQGIGIPVEEIEAAIKRALELSDQELDELYQEAFERTMKLEESLRESIGVQKLSKNKVAERMAYINAMKKQTAGTFKNITSSLGFSTASGGKVVFKPIAKFYQDTLDLAHVQVASGAFDHNTAIQQAVKRMANSGLRTVDYASGWVNSVDVAVRRATMTGLSQVTAYIVQQTAKDLGTDLVEVSAHMGARPDHAVWQGKVYSMSGNSSQYPDLASATGYGTGPGLMGWNCRHSMYPFVEGVSKRAYTDAELKNIDPPPFAYEGRTYTAYEATQMQRKLEASMRKSKREMVAYDAAGLEDDFSSSAIKLRRQREYYEDFSRKAGLKTHYERAQSVGYGKSVARKAAKAGKTPEKLVEFRKKYAAANNNDLLPNFEKSVIPDEKISGYALNMNHPKGRDKAIVFKNILGYTVDNKSELVEEIRHGLATFKATERMKTQYGTPFEVRMMIKGANGNYAKVKTGWMIDVGSEIPRLTSVYIYD